MLFRKVDIASLVFFRIAFGVLAFADVLNTWIYYDLMTNAYAPERFRFSYYGFQWVQPFPEPFLSIFFLLLSISALFIALGKWYRYSTVFFAIGFTYVFLLEKAHYLNHGYLFCWISWILIFLPAHRTFSLDVAKNPNLHRDHIPYWCLFLLQFLMGVVYFFGGIAKINPDWLRGMPLLLWLEYKGNIPILGPIIQQDWVAYFMAYGGLFLDLFIVPLLLFRRTRVLALLMAIFFHAMNHLIFTIGIFPYLSLSLTLLYFSPDFPRKVLSWVDDKVFRLKKIISGWNRKVAHLHAPVPLWQENPGKRKWMIIGISIIILLHLLIPLRHHLFITNVNWTEEGHRYSWRMMLRSKQGHGNFSLHFPNTGEEIKINPKDYLNGKQERKLYTHPDMILQFAHFLRDKYQEEGKPVEVYANIRVKLNQRSYQTYVDPEVDLAKVEWSFFKRSNWILAMEQE